MQLPHSTNYNFEITSPVKKIEQSLNCFKYFYTWRVKEKEKENKKDSGKFYAVDLVLYHELKI